MTVSANTEATVSRFQPVIDALGATLPVEGRREALRVCRLPARKASYAKLATPLPNELVRALAGDGIDRLYSHQVAAIESVRAGKHTVVVTRTASGKSLCYQLPVFETLLTEPDATAFFLYPTKALAQDQLRGLKRVIDAVPALGSVATAGTYDGDTSAHTRRKLRDQGNLILTNPDMLHRGILPYHGRWFRFLERLRYVVIDEVHTYRGIFGSHVAQVLRRLRRILDHYGIEPTFVLCSATIGNPGELASLLVGDDVTVVDRDGSPAGAKTFVFWNPPHKDATALERRSSNVEAQRWLTELIDRGIPSIAFAKTRVTAELIYRYTAEELAKRAKGLAGKISPYRGGYLPRERRAIEQRLFSGDLLGVVSTNALELGIDVGALDASVLVGFPSTVASTWQRAGRAGRSGDESLAVVIAYNEPIDQYLVRRPEDTLDKCPEQAVVDLHNPYILASQLSCAAAELPLVAGDETYFGDSYSAVAGALEEDDRLKKIDGSWYWSSTDFPAAKVNLRNMSDDTVTIMDVTRKNEVIGQVNSLSAPELVYPEAIYLHEGRTYYVRELDLEQQVAFVEPRDVDYYTQAIVDDRIRVAQPLERAMLRAESFGYGELDVHWATVAFKKIQFYHLDSIGFHTLDLPYQELHTTGFWYSPSRAVAGLLKRDGLSTREGLAGLRNVLSHLVPRAVMCDRQDLGTSIEASNTGLPTLFVYDRYPGGIGFAEKAFTLLPEVLARGLDLVSSCPCRTGCPSCVGVPPLDPGVHDDPEVRLRPSIPGKAATMALLRALVGVAVATDPG